MQEKQVPYDVDAEEAVLGSILLDSENAVPACMGAVEVDDFYREKNGWLYDSAVTLYLSGALVNTVTLAHALQQQSRLDAAGGVGYLSQLVTQCPTSVGVEDYAAIVRKCALNRRLIHAAARITKIGYRNAEPNEALGEAQEELLQLAGLVGGGRLRSLRDVALAHQVEIEAMLEHPEIPIGVPTGFTDIDTTMGGFEAGRFYTIGARPSMGKSAFALSLSVNVAKQGKGVAVFSLEMSELSVLYRLVFSDARINRYATRIGQAPQGWQERFRDSLGDVTGLPIWLDDTSAITTAQVRSRITQLKAQAPHLGMVVFDYGDLAGDEGDNEVTRLSNITRNLQALAKGASVAVLGIYQLNREVEKGDNKRPTMAHFRNTGVVEQCADVVMMLYRPAYYYEQQNKPTPPNEENIMEVLIRKQRDGATGVVKLYFDRKTGYIGNLEGRYA